MRIAAFFSGKFDRAEIISFQGSQQYVKVFFIDYGTTETINLDHCRILVEEFARVQKKAIRGALFGVRPPGNARLWDINVTMSFIEKIRDKTHRIQIMRHHEEVSRIILFQDTCRVLNEIKVMSERIFWILNKFSNSIHFRFHRKTSTNLSFTTATLK